MSKTNNQYSHKFVPWHGVLYTNIGTQIGHGFLSLVNSTIYHLKHGNNFDQKISVQNYGLQPYIRSTSTASNSAINFGSPFSY